MASFPDEVFFATAVELNQRLVRREFSAVELARAFGERIEKLGPRYNALALSFDGDLDGELVTAIRFAGTNEAAVAAAGGQPRHNRAPWPAIATARPDRMRHPATG